MWRTVYGDRVLKGAEAAIFAASILDIVRRGELRDSTPFGIPVFDSLMYPQRIAILHQAAFTLFRPEIPVPEPTAILEGAVAAVVYNIYELLKREVLDRPSDTSFRTLLARAVRTLARGEIREMMPDDSSDDLGEWAGCMDSLHYSILSDRCYLGGSAGISPELAGIFNRIIGGNPNYYRATVPTPTPPQMAILREELEQLCLRARGTSRPKASARKPRRTSGGKVKKKPSNPISLREG